MRLDLGENSLDSKRDEVGRSLPQLVLVWEAAVGEKGSPATPRSSGLLGKLASGENSTCKGLRF